MRAKSCIIYGCMRTKDVVELEHSGKFYCSRHFPKAGRSPGEGRSPQKETAKELRKTNIDNL
jgi:hypothetical protein